MATTKPATEKHYVSALRSFHLESVLSITVFDNPRIDLVIRGGKRVYGEGVKRLRFPLTASILLRMVNEIRLDEEGINVKSALCVAFAGFLRSGEFTWDTWSEQHHASHLSRKYVSFATDSITLTLSMSKTDLFCKGINIHLASSQSPLCPVTALTQLFNTFPCSPLQPLFTRSHGQPFTKQFFVAKIRQLLLQAGIPTAGFSALELRCGRIFPTYVACHAIA